MKRGGSVSQTRGGASMAVSGTIMLHAVTAWVLLVPGNHEDVPQPPIYRVNLVAAPRPEPNQRRAPEAVQRPADNTPVVPIDPPKQTSKAPETPPPPTPQPEEREPAPRTTPPDPPKEDAEPSTGTDPTTVEIEGVDFPFPAYLNNIVAQVYKQWNRPANQSLRAEVFFLIRKDGTITNMEFVQRSGSFAFDLEAQGAIEAAANVGAFGPLPEGFTDEILPVRFYFEPSNLRGRR